MEETKNFLDELLEEVEAKEVSLHLAHVDLVLGEISNLEEQIAKNFDETEKEKAILDDWTLRKNSKLQERIDWMSRKLEAFMKSSQETTLRPLKLKMANYYVASNLTDWRLLTWMSS